MIKSFIGQVLLSTTRCWHHQLLKPLFSLLSHRLGIKQSWVLKYFHSQGASDTIWTYDIRIMSQESHNRVTRGLYYKTLWIRNIRQMDIFCKKLVSYIVDHRRTKFDKHTRVRTHNVFIVQALGPIALAKVFWFNFILKVIIEKK